jgi:hypothetical protein
MIYSDAFLRLTVVGSVRMTIRYITKRVLLKLQCLLKNLTLRFAISGEESSSLKSIEVLGVAFVGVAAPFGVLVCSFGVKEC